MTAREIAEKLCRITDTSFKHIPTITQALEEREREGYERAIRDAIHAVVCTPKFPLSDHDAHIRAADAIRSLAHPSRSEKGDV